MAGKSVVANKTTGTTLRRMVCVIGLGAMAACTSIERNHGYIPPQDDIDSILVGVDTRDTVEDVVGSATSGGILDTSGLYFVQSRFRTFGPFEPKEIERQVLAITFDENGVVENVARFGLERGQAVVLERRVTDDGLNGNIFLQQLLGNFGRVDAGQLLGAPS